MKVLTLHQPWATLIALGVKTIETRSWRAPASLIGQRIAIHASKGDVIPLGGLNFPPTEHAQRHDGETWEDARERADAHNRQTWLVIHTISDPAYQGPRAVNPKTGRTSRVPMRAQSVTLFWPHAGPWYRPSEGEPEYTHTEYLSLGAIVATAVLVDCVPMIDEHKWGSKHLYIGGFDSLWIRDRRGAYAHGEIGGGDPDDVDVTDQSPFGDFRPGRWAWLLADVQPLPEPVPFRGGQGLTKEWTP